MTLLTRVCVALLLGVVTACGGGGGSGDGSSGGDPIDDALVYVGEVLDSESPIVALAVARNTSEALGVVGSRNPDDSLGGITQVLYTTESGETLTLTVGPDGLPESVEDASGAKVVFSNYTVDTVDVTVLDAQGNVIAGPETVAVNPDDLADLRSRFTALNKVSALADAASFFSNTAEVLKFAAFSLSFYGCTTAIGTFIGTLGTAAPLLLACIPLLLSYIVEKTKDEIGAEMLLLLDGVQCLMLNAGSCLSLLSFELKELGDLVGGGGTPPPPPPDPSPFEGTLTGTWIGACFPTGCPVTLSGGFTIHIDANGVVTGNFTGQQSGAIAGTVSADGTTNLATGVSGNGCAWTGNMGNAGGSLSGGGGWTCEASDCDCVGTWSGP